MILSSEGTKENDLGLILRLKKSYVPITASNNKCCLVEGAVKLPVKSYCSTSSLEKLMYEDRHRKWFWAEG